ncbi:hypothetical protein TNCV_4105701 [Trichonephila clavipes]|nr:hypothetical protein TNCV_4105701 [Trichonephila clavipes]
MDMQRNAEGSSSCASSSCSNARELDEQILEVKINPQEKNTVLDTSTNKNILFKEKESENQDEETKLSRNDFAYYVGTPIDADLREQILKLSPYQPEGNFQKDAKGRSFSSSYYSFISKAGQKIERKWLCYSTRLHVAYCQALLRRQIRLQKVWKVMLHFLNTPDINLAKCRGQGYDGADNMSGARVWGLQKLIKDNQEQITFTV